ncbi:hypothetical protein [Pasteuria penetrans]|uniref:hypothetical protein n=1 Tax=Pasteuria penetrans TaxID=86005 RepID=UPI0011EFFD9B|nr:hypothetical protein [Pasteuria penetrans]
MVCLKQPTYNPKQGDARGLGPTGLTGRTICDKEMIASCWTRQHGIETRIEHSRGRYEECDTRLVFKMGKILWDHKSHIMRE